jgi:vacuolar-type H+-ATPase subunit I/STV1
MAIRAEFKTTDMVPILSTPIVHIFGSDIRTLNKMSRMERFFEHAWYLFATFVTGFVTVVGLLIAFRAETYSKLGVVGAGAFILIWLFSIIQFLSFVGYFRWRLKH